MLLVKLLFLVAGGGTVAGVTYTQVKKSPTEKTVVVSNNQESKIRAKLEKKMDKELLEYKKNILNTTKTNNTKSVEEEKKTLDEKEKELQKSYDDLNASKQTLNSTASSLKTQYETLQTKDNALKTALDTKMNNELTANEKSLKKEFYEAQKSAYEKEKNAVVEKINAIYSPNSVTSDNICSGSTASWNPTPPASTSEETAIIKEITAELQLICSGIESATTQISANNSSTTTNNFDSTKTDRESVITQINQLTQQYNLQIIDIKAKENHANMKLFHFQTQQKKYSDAKIRLQQTNNELEIIEQQIQNT